MEITVIGINHKTAPVEIRERFSFAPKEAVSVNSALREGASLAENVVLSTCNRVEIYAVANHGADYLDRIKGFIGSFHDLDLSDYERNIYIYKNKDAVDHLFGVAAGLDSMVIGEMEILGQVKKAYHDARASRTTGKVLNRLFEKAFNAAKKIRTDTFIGCGSVSVGSAAVRLAKKILGGLNDKEVLIIGSGAVGEQLALNLKKSGIRSIFVANRTLEKAQDLASRFSAGVVSFEEFWKKLIDVDIVITSTGAPHHIIQKDKISSIMPKRGQRPLFIIDLAVPRDVEEDVNGIDNVYLYNIDELEKIVDSNMDLRKSELDKCASIIDAASKNFMRWLAKESLRSER